MFLREYGDEKGTFLHDELDVIQIGTRVKMYVTDCDVL